MRAKMRPAVLLVSMLPLTASFQHPPSLGGLRRAGPFTGREVCHDALTVRSTQLRRRAACASAMSIKDASDMHSTLLHSTLLADAQMTLEQAVAGKGGEKAAVAVDAAKGYVEGVTPKVPTTPGLLEQITAGDSLVLTLMATVVFVLTIVVTVGSIYLTVVNFQEEQYKEKLNDPRSKEYETLAREIAGLESQTKGPVSGKGKAMREAQQLDSVKASGNAPTTKNSNPMLTEPGNRDSRRFSAKKKRKEEARQRKAEKLQMQKGDAGLSSVPGQESENKGILGGIMDTFK